MVLVMSILYPRHEQHYPDKLLPHRLEEYVRSDGSPPTQNRAYAKRVTGQQVVEAVLEAQQRLNMHNIDARYFVSTCFHEAGCENEWDTEVASPSCYEGFVSVGAFQIGKEEAQRHGYQLEDMLDLKLSAACMVQLAEWNRAQLRVAARLGVLPDPDYLDGKGVLWKGGTMRAYLAIAHNHGVGFTRKTLAANGMDWDAYKRRNPQDKIVSHRYGEDCITGGPMWWEKTTEVATPEVRRTLFLTHPFMKGTDVKELQRYLKVKDDGVFGPQTEAALKLYQRGHQLEDNGICDQKTWDRLVKQ